MNILFLHVFYHNRMISTEKEVTIWILHFIDVKQQNRWQHQLRWHAGEWWDERYTANKRNRFNRTQEIGSMDANVPSIKCIFRPFSASSKRFANSFSQETVECFNPWCSIFIISFIQNISASACVEVLTEFNENFNIICDMSAHTYTQDVRRANVLYTVTICNATEKFKRNILLKWQ